MNKHDFLQNNISIIRPKRRSHQKCGANVFSCSCWLRPLAMATPQLLDNSNMSIEAKELTKKTTGKGSIE